MSGSKGTVDNFHRLYYGRDLQSDTYWFGRHIFKCPLDLHVIQEIINATDPDLIVETGTYMGGSALYYAHLCDLRGKGEIVSVDIAVRDDLPDHPRIEFLAGMSSISPEVLEIVRDRAKGKRTMVILDSDHRCDHVLQELRAYHSLVSVGCFLIVEDTNVNGNPVLREHGPGPAEAVKAFQPKNHGFEREPACERLLMTFNPGGYWKRVR